MASIRLLRGRIKSVKNIAQITKAMEMVAASKMKKAQAAALAGKLYAEKIFTMVMELGAKSDVSHHPLMGRPKTMTGKRLVILLSTNKGLCGSLNTNLFRFFLESYPKLDVNDYMTYGRKGAAFLSRMNAPVQLDFSESPQLSFVAALTDTVTEKFTKGMYDGVDIIYSDFINSLIQKPKKKTILPLTLENLPAEHMPHFGEFLIEPTTAEVFSELLPHYLENQIRDAVLESEASEHSARMVAMRNATDSALTLIDELTLLFNKVRQEKITYEISDMVTARLAVEEA